MRRVSIFFHLFFLFSLRLISAKEPALSSPLMGTHPMHSFHPNKSSDIVAVKPPLVMQRAFIMIDPGHGGHDIGTQSISKPRYQEKSLNMATAQFVKSYLQQLGYRVVLTREEDKFVSLDKRALMANEQKPALFVSIHYNSAPSAEAQGIEVFYYQSLNGKQRTAKSKKLAQAILAEALLQTGAKSRGVKQGNFAVIRETNMPAVLIEGGFVTNEAEMLKLKDPAYLKKLAWGIVKGIDDYLN